MIICNILQAGELLELLEPNVAVTALSDLRAPQSLSTWFLEGETAVNYRFVGNTIYSVHLHSKERKNMKGIANFAYRAGLYMQEQYGMTTALSTVSRDKLNVRFMLRQFNSEKIYEDEETVLFRVRRY